MMAVLQHVTLAELLEVQDGGISEINAWSLLCQSTVTLLESSKSSQSSWLVTPDTMLLYRSGVVKFCPGISNADGNHFIAPELYGMKHFHSINELERTYVYSLGMTIYYGLEYQGNGQTKISEQLEDVLNKMTIEAADERISLNSVYKVCKEFQGKNASVILSSKISQMVESVLGELLEFSYDLSHNLLKMDDESLERELQQAASMKTSSERLSSCGATGSSLSLTSSHQGMLSSTGSFRKVARHHSNVSIKSLGSSSHDWSAGLAASLPLPSQRWSSYDGLHAPLPLNPGALSFEGERRQLPVSPGTIPHSVTIRRHSVSQETTHMAHAENRRQEGQKLCQPKSADVSGFQEVPPVSNKDESQNDSLELPQLHQPPLKKFLLPLDTPPSPVSIPKLSPKVAASLERINQLLASDSPLQQTDINNSVTTGSDLRALEPVVVNSVKHHTSQPSPMLNDRLLPTANVDEVEEEAPPVPLSSPPGETDFSDVQEKFSNATSQIQSSKNVLLLEDSTVNFSSNFSNQFKQQMDKTKVKLMPEKALATSYPNVDRSHVHQQLEVRIEQCDDKHRIVGQHKHPSHQQEQLTQVELQQKMPQHEQQKEYGLQHQLLQQHKQKYHHKQEQEQHEQEQHGQKLQPELEHQQQQEQQQLEQEQQLQQEQEQQRHKLEQQQQQEQEQQRQHGKENHKQEQQQKQLEQPQQKQQENKQLDEQKQQRQHEQEQQQPQHEQEQQQPQHEQEQQKQHEQEQQQPQHEQEQQKQHEQEQQQPQHELEQQQQQHELEQQQQHEQEQQQEDEQKQQKYVQIQQRHEQKQQQLEQQQQQHEPEEEQRHEQQQQQQKQEQQRHEQEQQQRHEEEEQQQPEHEKQKRHEQVQQQHEEEEQQQLEHEIQQQNEQEQQQQNEKEQQHKQEQHVQDYQQQQPQNYEPEHNKQEQKHEGGGDMLTSMITMKNTTPENTQMTSTFRNRQIDTEEPEYATVADTKRTILKLVTPYAVTELSRARSEHQIYENKHQIDENELCQPLAGSMDSVIDDTNTLEMSGTEYDQAYSKKVAINNDAMLTENFQNNLTDCLASATAQDTSTTTLQPLLGKDTNVTVTVFPGTLQNDDNDDYGSGDDSKEHSVPFLMMNNKKENVAVNNLEATSNGIKLRHSTLQTSAGLLMKSNSTENFKGSGVKVNDPRRHSALPVSNDFGNNDVSDCNSTATSTQVIMGEKFEPTYDEDWCQLQVTSVEKLQNVLGPEFTSLVGRKLEGNASTRPMFYSAYSNRRQVNVVLLNDKIYSVTVELSSKCQDVFNQVISYLSLGEPHVFGLSIVKGGEDYFLNLNKRLIKYAPDGWLQKAASSVRDSQKASPVFTVYFRIRFFVENVHELKTNQTRHQYYLQLRRDLQKEKIYCHEETALLLASYSLQVEKGNYGPPLEGKEYYQLEDYMPPKAIDQLTKDKINSVLPHMHSELKGLSKESAQWQFLQEMQKLTEYGQIFYQLFKDKQIRHSTVIIGFCVRGLILYDIINKDTKIPTHKLSWRHIENIVFKQRRFELHIIGSDEPIVYYVSSPKKALYLFGLAKSYHYFQLKCREPVSARSESWEEEPVPKQKSEQCEVIKLLKEPATGLGFKIMSGKKMENREGIFVKSIIKGMPAYIDGRMRPFDQIVAINGVSVAGCDHKEVGRMVQQSPPHVQITVIHHYHDEEEHLLSMSYNKQSLLGDSTDYEQQTPVAAGESRPNFNDDTKYRTVSVTKDNNHLGFDVKGGIQGVYISNLEPGTATARKKLLQVGSIIVAVNGQSVEGQTVHEVLQLLLSCHYHMELTVQLPSDYSSSDDDTYVEGDQFVVNIDRGDDEDFGLQIIKKTTVHCPTGLFFVKSIIPESPAYCCNKLMENDIILQVNDKILKDCTDDEARQVLYRAGQCISLLVCRSVIGMLSNSPSFVDNIVPLHGNYTNIRDTIPGHESGFDITLQPHSSHTSTNDTSNHRTIRDMTTFPHSSHTSIKDTLRHHEVSVKLNVTLIKAETSFGIAFEVCFCKESKETTLGLVVGGKPLPFDQVTLQITSQLRDAYQQEQQILGVAILQIHSNTLAAEEGSLCVGDFIDKINDVKVSGNADDVAEMLKEAIGIITLRICRYPSSEVSKLQPSLPTSEDQHSSGVLPSTHQKDITTEAPMMTSLTVEDTLPTTEDPTITSLTVEDTLPTTEDPTITSLTVEDTLPTTEDPTITSMTVEDTLPTTEDPTITSLTVEDTLLTTEAPMITSLTLMVEDTIPLEVAAIEGSSTPPPPLSSPPPLSPAKGVDVVEEWSEPQLNNRSSDTAESCSPFDSDDAEEILNEIDQSTYHTNLSVIDAKGMNDSLGTLSSLSEDISVTSSDSLTESHNCMCRPPSPLSPPPDL